MNLHAELTATLTVVLVALLRLGRAYVQAHVTPEKLAHVTDLARMAVRAAEQVGEDSVPPEPLTVANGLTPAPVPDSAPLLTVVPEPPALTGPDKYALASDALVAGAKRLGVRLKPDEVTAFIHAALREMHGATAVLAES